MAEKKYLKNRFEKNGWQKTKMADSAILQARNLKCQKKSKKNDLNKCRTLKAGPYMFYFIFKWLSNLIWLCDLIWSAYSAWSAEKCQNKN